MFNFKNVKNDSQTGTYKMNLVTSWLLTASGIFLMFKIKDMDISVLYKNDIITSKLTQLLKILSQIHF